MSRFSAFSQPLERLLLRRRHYFGIQLFSAGCTGTRGLARPCLRGGSFRDIFFILHFLPLSRASAIGIGRRQKTTRRLSSFGN
jgi:hypothetical protein